jgi:RNA polymerase sigma factor (sigma-70 family)
VSSPARRGDEAELFERHAARLLRIVRSAIGGRHHVAEDACSFAWLQLLRTQPERDRLFAWLCAVATNEARHQLKRQARHVEFEESPAEPTRAHVDERSDLELGVEARQALEQMRDELSEQKLRIFSLHIAGLSYDEICAATGYSRRQVDRHMRRSRARLRERRKEAQPLEDALASGGGQVR